MAALSLFGSLQALFELADWARFLVFHWQRILQAVWSTIFGAFGLSATPAMALMMTFFSSLSVIGIGAVFLQMRETGPAKGTFFSYEHYVRFTRGLAIALLAMFAFRLGVEALVLGTDWRQADSSEFYRFLLMGLAAFFGFILILVHSGWTMVRDSLVATAFVATFYFIIAYPSATVAAQDAAHSQQYRTALPDASCYTLVLNLTPILTWAEPKFLNSRFLLVALGLTTLIFLNFISSLGVSLKAPL